MINAHTGIEVGADDAGHVYLAGLRQRPSGVEDALDDGTVHTAVYRMVQGNEVVGFTTAE